ncbi:unnamed protein product [Chilo suppressalis]|uniref:Cyclin-like domain-containing protein n=1 Tax=Chilo suppressalis TaxID=168631 RepID=A0ABN8B240_CHISP|nr:unnamed protein product [Chilo suppressalis]
MAAEKENVNRLKTITKIPLPVDPLPALPKHLFEIKSKTNMNASELNNRLAESKSKPKDLNERYPLRTLNSQQNLAVPGPSHRTKEADVRPKQKIDARYVTRRPKTENLDWDFRVFKDDVTQEDKVIIISDDEDSSKEKKYKFFVANKQKSCLGESMAAVTPAVKNLEPNRVKKLKRSLKRPHSRELQGLPSEAKEQKKVGDKIRPKLYFNEPLQERLMSPDFLRRSYMVCHTRDYSTDTFDYLLGVEQRPVTPNISSKTRACVINWLMRVNGPDGNPATVQTAVWYLDSVLATGQVQVNKLQLVAAACYWVAHKLHGPGLSATRLVNCSNYAFTTEDLLCAEKSILQRLKFPSQPVVAQEYITYLSWWCDRYHPGEIEVAATFLCMCGIMVDKSLCNEYPSVVACAAVRNVLLLLDKKHLMTQLQLCPIFRSAEKKASNMAYTCSLLRRAVRTVVSTAYEYKAPFEHYGTPPSYIAQRIFNASIEFNIIDIRNTCRNN